MGWLFRVERGTWGFLLGKGALGSSVLLGIGEVSLQIPLRRSTPQPPEFRISRYFYGGHVNFLVSIDDLTTPIQLS